MTDHTLFKVGDRVIIDGAAGVLTRIFKIGGDKSCFHFLTIKTDDGKSICALPEWVRLIQTGGGK